MAKIQTNPKVKQLTTPTGLFQDKSARSSIDDLAGRLESLESDADAAPIKRFRGDWSSRTVYQRGDVVAFMGSTWIAVADVSVATMPGEMSSVWQWLAKRGIDGVNGGIGGGSSGSHVNVSNILNALYITGDDITEDSIRILFTEGDDEAHIERRESGVWNDTGFRFASSSVSLGRDLRMGAVGGFIETLNISEIDDHLKALIPHIQFDATGTIGAAHTPVLDARQDFITFAGPATGEVLGTTLGQIFSATPTRVLHSSTHITGATAATADVQISYYKGTDNTGSLLNRFVIPSSVMTANTTFTTVYDDDFGFENAQNIFFEFVSTNNISLATNASDEIITTQNGHTLAELDIILDELVIAEDLSLVFDESLGLVINNRF